MDERQKNPGERSLSPEEAAKIWNRIRKRRVLRRLVRHAVVGAVFVATAVWLYAVNEWAFALCSAGVTLLCALRISDDVGELRDIRDCSWPSMAPTILVPGPHAGSASDAPDPSENRPQS